MRVSVGCGSTVIKCRLSVWNPHVQPSGMWCAPGSMEGLNAVVHASPVRILPKRRTPFPDFPCSRRLWLVIMGGGYLCVHPGCDDLIIFFSPGLNKFDEYNVSSQATRSRAYSTNEGSTLIMRSSFTSGIVSVHYLLGLPLAYALRSATPNNLMLLVKLTYSL